MGHGDREDHGREVLREVLRDHREEVGREDHGESLVDNDQDRHEEDHGVRVGRDGQVLRDEARRGEGPRGEVRRDEVQNLHVHQSHDGRRSGRGVHDPMGVRLRYQSLNRKGPRRCRFHCRSSHRPAHHARGEGRVRRGEGEGRGVLEEGGHEGQVVEEGHGEGFLSHHRRVGDPMTKGRMEEGAGLRGPHRSRFRCRRYGSDQRKDDCCLAARG